MGGDEVKEAAEERDEDRRPEEESDDDVRHERVMAVARRIIERDAEILHRLGTV